MRAAFKWLSARAENVAVGFLTVMFLAFVVQIGARYLLNAPLGWTLELCLTMWLWVVFWGTAFCVRDRDQVRFDIFYHAVSPRTRKVFAMISALAIIVGFVVSLPATWDYISFLYIKKSATLRIRLGYVFSVYLLFMVAVIIRYAVRIPRLVRLGAPEDHPEDTGEIHVHPVHRTGEDDAR